MEYRNLGRTGVKVSPLCLGAMYFRGVTQEADAIQIVHTALDTGFNFINRQCV
jgi:aryl-alcohol dehydrogenase-like predicted oxidoreductase